MVLGVLHTTDTTVDRLNISLDFGEAIAVIIDFGGQIFHIVSRFVGRLVKTVETVEKALLVLYVVLRLSEYAHTYRCERYAYRKQADEFWPFKLSQIQNITPLSPFSSAYGYSSV